MWQTDGRTDRILIARPRLHYMQRGKNDVQKVHRQPAHKLTNDDATDESLLWCHIDVIIGCSIAKKARKIFTHLHAWSIAMEHAKNYEIRCKIIWNIRTKPVAPFSGQCNLRFLSTIVLQGSVATRVNYDRIFLDSFTANLLQSVMAKEFWKSVSISQSYRQK